MAYVTGNSHGRVESRMFTGIVSDIGTIERTEMRGDLRARISCRYDMASVDLGASIACDGVCLTVVAKGADWFEVDISAETLSKTNIGGNNGWHAGKQINLERALRVGDELGGHIVSGHVDGIAVIDDIRDDGDSIRVTFSALPALTRFIAMKGSVALNGTSLTVNEVEGDSFGVNLIPHTREFTTWSERVTGDGVNLEIDTLARYVARLAEAG